MNCESEQAAVGAMFDAFCKEVLRNTIFNYKRKIKRQSNRELITPDPEKYISARDAVFDVYETDHQRRHPAQRYTFLDPMLTLPRNLLGVLLLKFWHGQKDAIIANHFGVSTRTIRQWRSLAIVEIRKWYQEKEVETRDTS